MGLAKKWFDFVQSFSWCLIVESFVEHFIVTQLFLNFRCKNLCELTSGRRATSFFIPIHKWFLPSTSIKSLNLPQVLFKIFTVLWHQRFYWTLLLRRCLFKRNEASLIFLQYFLLTPNLILLSKAFLIRLSPERDVDWHFLYVKLWYLVN